MTVLTLRRVRDHFVVTGPDIEPRTFKTRVEARDWCREHFHGSPIREKVPAAPPRDARRPRPSPAGADRPPTPASRGEEEGA